MQIQRSFVVDSAIAVSLCSALCFFLGGAWEQGRAAGLGLPAEFMTRDLWRTVAAGFDAIFASVIYFPFSFVGEGGPRWNVVNASMVAAVVLVALLWFFRKSKLKAPLFALWAVAYAFHHIYIMSANNIQDWVRRSERCLRGEGCPEARVPQKVTYVVADGDKREGTGMFLSMNSRHLILYSSGGLLIVPVENVKEITTAKPLPTK